MMHLIKHFWILQNNRTRRKGLETLRSLTYTDSPPPPGLPEIEMWWYWWYFYLYRWIPTGQERAVAHFMIPFKLLRPDGIRLNWIGAQFQKVKWKDKEGEWQGGMNKWNKRRIDRKQRRRKQVQFKVNLQHLYVYIKDLTRKRHRNLLLPTSLKNPFVSPIQ